MTLPARASDPWTLPILDFEESKMRRANAEILLRSAKAGGVLDSRVCPHFHQLMTAWMDAAFALAQEALDAAEVPVGCVFVHKDQVIAKGRNRTNETRNGTRHAELEAIESLYARLSHQEFTRTIQETDVFVTVEPCVMCASALMELGVRHVYFGCWNERFGGCGSVLDVPSMVQPPTGGFVECQDRRCMPLRFEGGHGKDRAILLLRKFYLMENHLAPEPRKKRGRKLKLDDLDMTKVTGNDGQ